MFSIGDKIVYPMQCRNNRIHRRKEILGEKKRYYVMKMPVGDMKVMIPLTMLIV